jgi:hypothetical protein
MLVERNGPWGGPEPPESETDEPAATQTTDDDSARQIWEAFRRHKADKDQVAQQTHAMHSEPDQELRKPADEIRKPADEIRTDPYASGESGAERRARERAELTRDLGIDHEQTQT